MYAAPYERPLDPFAASGSRRNSGNFQNNNNNNHSPLVLSHPLPSNHNNNSVPCPTMSPCWLLDHNRQGGNARSWGSFGHGATGGLAAPPPLDLNAGYGGGGVAKSCGWFSPIGSPLLPSSHHSKPTTAAHPQPRTDQQGLATTTTPSSLPSSPPMSTPSAHCPPPPQSSTHNLLLPTSSLLTPLPPPPSTVDLIARSTNNSRNAASTITTSSSSSMSGGSQSDTTRTTMVTATAAHTNSSFDNDFDSRQITPGGGGGGLSLLVYSSPYHPLHQYDAERGSVASVRPAPPPDAPPSHRRSQFLPPFMIGGVDRTTAALSPLNHSGSRIPNLRLAAGTTTTATAAGGGGGDDGGQNSVLTTGRPASPSFLMSASATLPRPQLYRRHDGDAEDAVALEMNSLASTSLSSTAVSPRRLGVVPFPGGGLRSNQRTQRSQLKGGGDRGEADDASLVLLPHEDGGNLSPAQTVLQLPSNISSSNGGCGGDDDDDEDPMRMNELNVSSGSALQRLAGVPPPPPPPPIHVSSLSLMPTAAAIPHPQDSWNLTNRFSVGVPSALRLDGVTPSSASPSSPATAMAVAAVGQRHADVLSPMFFGNLTVLTPRNGSGGSGGAVSSEPSLAMASSMASAVSSSLLTPQHNNNNNNNNSGATNLQAMQQQSQLAHVAVNSSQHQRYHHATSTAAAVAATATQPSSSQRAAQSDQHEALVRHLLAVHNNPHRSRRATRRSSGLSTTTTTHDSAFSSLPVGGFQEAQQPQPSLLHDIVVSGGNTAPPPQRHHQLPVVVMESGVRFSFDVPLLPTAAHGLPPSQQRCHASKQHHHHHQPSTHKPARGAGSPPAFPHPPTRSPSVETVVTTNSTGTWSISSR